jgi:hypothetical protein
MIYLKNILSKHEDEVVRKVYSAMKNKPLKGDWYNLVQSDFERIGMTLDEKCIQEADLNTYKNHIKKSVWAAWFQELQEKKLKHTKVQHISYDGIRRPQKYLTSPNFNNEMSSLLYNLRCKSVNSFRDNFHTMYGKAPVCRLFYSFHDSQEHALSCKVIIANLTQPERAMLNETKYVHLFGNVGAQEKVTRIFQIIISLREKLLSSTHTQGLPGLDNSGPS